VTNVYANRLMRTGATAAVLQPCVEYSVSKKTGPLYYIPK